MLFFKNRELIFVHDKQKRGNASKHAFPLISAFVIRQRATQTFL
ncbi:hypothetical protein HMPREF1369_01501 [Enterococcus faecium ERV99]|nr:hypothetical protein HMPREF1369_01501 [Enterococcus faecium ERV99]